MYKKIYKQTSSTFCTSNVAPILNDLLRNKSYQLRDVF